MFIQQIISPSANNTAFDGYAINYLDTKNLNKNNTKKFRIIKTIAAGDNPKIKKENFSAIEVMTGAIISRPFNKQLYQLSQSKHLKVKTIIGI